MPSTRPPASSVSTSRPASRRSSDNKAGATKDKSRPSDIRAPGGNVAAQQETPASPPEGDHDPTTGGMDADVDGSDQNVGRGVGVLNAAPGGATTAGGGAEDPGTRTGLDGAEDDGQPDDEVNYPQDEDDEVFIDPSALTNGQLPLHLMLGSTGTKLVRHAMKDELNVKRVSKPRDVKVPFVSVRELLRECLDRFMEAGRELSIVDTFTEALVNDQRATSKKRAASTAGTSSYVTGPEMLQRMKSRRSGTTGGGSNSPGPLEAAGGGPQGPTAGTTNVDGPERNFEKEEGPFSGHKIHKQAWVDVGLEDGGEEEKGGDGSPDGSPVGRGKEVRASSPSSGTASASTVTPRNGGKQTTPRPVVDKESIAAGKNQDAKGDVLSEICNATEKGEKIPTMTELNNLHLAQFAKKLRSLRDARSFSHTGYTTPHGPEHEHGDLENDMEFLNAPTQASSFLFGAANKMTSSGGPRGSGSRGSGKKVGQLQEGVVKHHQAEPHISLDNLLGPDVNEVNRTAREQTGAVLQGVGGFGLQHAPPAALTDSLSLDLLAAASFFGAGGAPYNPYARELSGAQQGGKGSTSTTIITTTSSAANNQRENKDAIIQHALQHMNSSPSGGNLGGAVEDHSSPHQAAVTANLASPQTTAVAPAPKEKESRSSKRGKDHEKEPRTSKSKSKKDKEKSRTSDQQEDAEDGASSAKKDNEDASTAVVSRVSSAKDSANNADADGAGALVRPSKSSSQDAAPGSSTGAKQDESSDTTSPTASTMAAAAEINFAPEEGSHDGPEGLHVALTPSSGVLKKALKTAEGEASPEGHKKKKMMFAQDDELQETREFEVYRHSILQDEEEGEDEEASGGDKKKKSKKSKSSSSKTLFYEESSSNIMEKKSKKSSTKVDKDRRNSSSSSSSSSKDRKINPQKPNKPADIFDEHHDDIAHDIREEDVGTDHVEEPSKSPPAVMMFAPESGRGAKTAKSAVLSSVNSSTASTGKGNALQSAAKRARGKQAKEEGEAAGRGDTSFSKPGDVDVQVIGGSDHDITSMGADGIASTVNGLAAGAPGVEEVVVIEDRPLPPGKNLQQFNGDFLLLPSPRSARVPFVCEEKNEKNPNRALRPVSTADLSTLSSSWWTKIEHTDMGPDRSRFAADTDTARPRIQRRRSRSSDEHFVEEQDEHVQNVISHGLRDKIRSKSPGAQELPSQHQQQHSFFAPEYVNGLTGSTTFATPQLQDGKHQANRRCVLGFRFCLVRDLVEMHQHQERLLQLQEEMIHWIWQLDRCATTVYDNSDLPYSGSSMGSNYMASTAGPSATKPGGTNSVSTPRVPLYYRHDVVKTTRTTRTTTTEEVEVSSTSSGDEIQFVGRGKDPVMRRVERTRSEHVEHVEIFTSTSSSSSSDEEAGVRVDCGRAEVAAPGVREGEKMTKRTPSTNKSALKSPTPSSKKEKSSSASSRRSSSSKKDNRPSSSSKKEKNKKPSSSTSSRRDNSSTRRDKDRKENSVQEERDVSPSSYLFMEAGEGTGTRKSSFTRGGNNMNSSMSSASQNSSIRGKPISEAAEERKSKKARKSTKDKEGSTKKDKDKDKDKEEKGSSSGGSGKNGKKTKEEKAAEKAARAEGEALSGSAGETSAVDGANKSHSSSGADSSGTDNAGRGGVLPDHSQPMGAGALSEDQTSLKKMAGGAEKGTRLGTPWTFDESRPGLFESVKREWAQQFGGAAKTSGADPAHQLLDHDEYNGNPNPLGIADPLASTPRSYNDPMATTTQMLAKGKNKNRSSLNQEELMQALRGDVVSGTKNTRIFKKKPQPLLKMLLTAHLKRKDSNYVFYNGDLKQRCMQLGNRVDEGTMPVLKHLGDVFFHDNHLFSANKMLNHPYYGSHPQASSAQYQEAIAKATNRTSNTTTTGFTGGSLLNEKGAMTGVLLRNVDPMIRAMLRYVDHTATTTLAPTDDVIVHSPSQENYAFAHFLKNSRKYLGLRQQELELHKTHMNETAFRNARKHAEMRRQKIFNVSYTDMDSAELMFHAHAFRTLEPYFVPPAAAGAPASTAAKSSMQLGSIIDASERFGCTSLGLGGGSSGVVGGAKPIMRSRMLVDGDIEVGATSLASRHLHPETALGATRGHSLGVDHVDSVVASDPKLNEAEMNPYAVANRGYYQNLQRTNRSNSTSGRLGLSPGRRRSESYGGYGGYGGRYEAEGAGDSCTIVAHESQSVHLDPNRQSSAVTAGQFNVANGQKAFETECQTGGTVFSGLRGAQIERKKHFLQRQQQALLKDALIDFSKNSSFSQNGLSPKRHDEESRFDRLYADAVRRSASVAASRLMIDSLQLQDNKEEMAPLTTKERDACLRLKKQIELMKRRGEYDGPTPPSPRHWREKVTPEQRAEWFRVAGAKRDALYEARRAKSEADKAKRAQKEKEEAAAKDKDGQLLAELKEKRLAGISEYMASQGEFKLAESVKKYKERCDLKGTDQDRLRERMEEEELKESCTFSPETGKLSEGKKKNYREKRMKDLGIEMTAKAEDYKLARKELERQAVLKRQVENRVLDQPLEGVAKTPKQLLAERAEAEKIRIEKLKGSRQKIRAKDMEKDEDEDVLDGGNDKKDVVEEDEELDTDEERRVDGDEDGEEKGTSSKKSSRSRSPKNKDPSSSTSPKSTSGRYYDENGRRHKSFREKREQGETKLASTSRGTQRHVRTSLAHAFAKEELDEMYVIGKPGYAPPLTIDGTAHNLRSPPEKKENGPENGFEFTPQLRNVFSDKKCWPISERFRKSTKHKVFEPEDFSNPEFKGRYIEGADVVDRLYYLDHAQPLRLESWQQQKQTLVKKVVKATTDRVRATKRAEKAAKGDQHPEDTLRRYKEEDEKYVADEEERLLLESKATRDEDGTLISMEGGHPIIITPPHRSTTKEIEEQEVRKAAATLAHIDLAGGEHIGVAGDGDVLDVFEEASLEHANMAHENVRQHSSGRLHRSERLHLEKVERRRNPSAFVNNKDDSPTAVDGEDAERRTHQVPPTMELPKDLADLHIGKDQQGVGDSRGARVRGLGDRATPRITMTVSPEELANMTESQRQRHLQEDLGIQGNAEDGSDILTALESKIITTGEGDNKEAFSLHLSASSTGGRSETGEHLPGVGGAASSTGVAFGSMGAAGHLHGGATANSSLVSSGGGSQMPLFQQDRQVARIKAAEKSMLRNASHSGSGSFSSVSFSSQAKSRNIYSMSSRSITKAKAKAAPAVPDTRDPLEKEADELFQRTQMEAVLEIGKEPPSTGIDQGPGDADGGAQSSSSAPRTSRKSSTSKTLRVSSGVAKRKSRKSTAARAEQEATGEVLAEDEKDRQTTNTGPILGHQDQEGAADPPVRKSRLSVKRVRPFGKKRKSSTAGAGVELPPSPVSIVYDVDSAEPEVAADDDNSGTATALGTSTTRATRPVCAVEQEPSAAPAPPPSTTAPADETRNTESLLEDDLSNNVGPVDDDSPQSNVDDDKVMDQLLGQDVGANINNTINASAGAKAAEEGNDFLRTKEDLSLVPGDSNSDSAVDRTSLTSLLVGGRGMPEEPSAKNVAKERASIDDDEDETFL
ncbi:unnamed protein product [Amoebophrya sp. A25]|nr:unnamed protein product [Amoebophrya sp. A25]|eukprot:GSA25T00012905001.1